MARERSSRRSCHNIPELDRAVSPPEATSPPSGENVTENTSSECLVSVRRGAPVVTSQSLTMPSFRRMPPTRHLVRKLASPHLNGL
jgi:hypothetical protein